MRVPNSPRYEFVEDAFGAVLHELGHSLGLPHDYRNRRDIMGSGFRELRWNLDPRWAVVGFLGGGTLATLRSVLL